MKKQTVIRYVGSRFLSKSLSMMVVNTVLATGTVYAYEFNASILEDMGVGEVDLSVFAGEVNRLSGDYRVDFNINSDRFPVLEDYPITFFVKDGRDQICFTSALMERLPIRKTAYEINTVDVNSTSEKCGILLTDDSSIKMRFDREEHVVHLTIPQAFIRPHDAQWVPPSSREYGITGAFVDYSLIWSVDQSKRNQRLSSGERKKRTETNSRLYSYGSVGLNIERFRFRGEYQYNSDSGNEKSLKWSQYYAFTDIGAWNAKVYAGQIYTRSNVFDTVRIKGVSLFSDENMMPSYLRGYAPEITGTVASNAVITLKYYGSVLRTVQVPPGAFAIGNLPSHISGKVTVEIQEENGTFREYDVDIARVPYLTRKGAFRYSANAGKVDPFGNRDGVDSKVISMDGSYGVTDYLSVFGGVFATTDRNYQAYSLGVGLNLDRFGAVSFDITRSMSDISDSAAKDQYDKTKYTGSSYRVNYAKRFTPQTNLNIAAYRFSTRDYTSFYNYTSMLGHNVAGSQTREKNRLSVSLSHHLQELDLYLSGTISRSRYWNAAGSTNYQVSMSKTLREGWLEGTSFNISLSKEKYQGRNDNERLSLFMTIPLKDHRQYVQYSNTMDNNNKSMYQELAYVAHHETMNYRIGATMNGQRDFSGDSDYALDGWFDASTGYGRFTASGNYQDERRNVTLGFEGGMTVTRHGVATHDRGSPTGARLIVDTGVSGVEIENTNSKSNFFGLAGVGNVSSYYNENYMVDSRKLPENVEIKSGVMKFATTDGAIIYRSTDPISGGRALVTVKLEDGSYPPFGAAVYRKNGDHTEVAIVADYGLTYLTGMNKRAEFMIEWRNGSCRLPIDSVEEVQELTCYQN